MADDLLPPNATALERNLATVNSRLGGLPVPIRDLKNPDTCPAPLLPWLAQELSVDQWDTDWSDLQKRQTVKASLGLHRVKGTIGAVRSALAALGIQSQLQEWFNQIPAGAPYTFRLLLTADQVGLPKEAILRIQSVLDSTKNLRSHLTEITPQVITSSNLRVGAVTTMGTQITVDDFGYSLLYDGTWDYDGLNRTNGIKLY